MLAKEFFHQLCMDVLQDIDLNKLCEEYHANYHIKEVFDYDSQIIMIIFFEIDKDNRRFTNQVTVDIGYLFAITGDFGEEEKFISSIKNTVINALTHPEEENNNDD